jgi:hypothetical protein
MMAAKAKDSGFKNAQWEKVADLAVSKIWKGFVNLFCAIY